MRTCFLAWLLPLFLVLGAFSAGTAHAQNSVNATISSETAEVGEEVTLQITFTGSGDASQPDLPNIPGLSMTFVGQASQYQLNNFKLTSSIVYSYSVVAERPGDYTIPALKARIGGNDYTTQPLKLRVGPQPQSQPATLGNGGNGTSSTGNVQADAKAYFATISLPKKEAYVGEALPVEIRILVDTRIRWELRDVPAFTSDGFTVGKLKLAQQGTTEQSGRVYDIYVFKTALTPVKSGDLNAGPCQFSTVMQIPQAPQQRRARRSASPFDQFFNDDDFPDPFGRQSFVTRQVNVTAPTVALHVKPLPAAGQPAGFTGAVGLFHLGSQSSVSEAKAGEPITLTTSVSGRGNFDRVSAPQLPPTPGWRAYPATGDFKAEDDLGVSGTKTFKVALVPEPGQTQLPALGFSYFDPEQEKYITLQTVRTPVTVQGAPTPAPSAAPSSALAATSPAPAKGQDIHYILPEARWDRKAFTLVYRQPWFLAAQSIPLAALIAFIGLRVMRSRGRTAGQERARELARQAAQLEAQWRKNGIGRAEFSEAATAWMAVLSEQNSRQVDDETKSTLRELTELHDELHYAGTSNRNEPLSPERRARFVAALEAFGKAK